METLEIGGHKLLKFGIGASSYLINPTDGARLLNWYITLADGSVRDIIYWPENAPLGGSELGDVFGGAPILFPFAGGSWADGREGFWKTPDGSILPMRKHGFANWGKYDTAFLGENEIRLRYMPSSEDAKSYPYDYEFEVYYRFGELSYSFEALLKNKGAKRIPWSLGYHPYFTMPWHRNLTKGDYRLVCDARKACYVRPDGSFPLADNLEKMCFSDPEMSPRIHTHLKSGVFRFGPKNGEEDVTIKVDGGLAKPGYCLVTWTKDAETPFYCVEPWMGLPNSSTNAKHFVEPNSQASFVVEVAIL